MKASKFSYAQKAFILKQGADGVHVADICRKATRKGLGTDLNEILVSLRQVVSLPAI